MILTTAVDGADNTHRHEHFAMACDWRILIRDASANYAAQAAQAAFDEVDRLEQELSRFVPTSDVSQVNAAPAGQWVAVGADTHECLLIARRMWEATGGAFDATVGAWLERRLGRERAAAEDTEPLPVGMQYLEINPTSRHVGKRVSELKIDLGAIGKGYAVDRAAAVLREWRIPAALISSGQSTAFGYETNGAGWKIGVRDSLKHDLVIQEIVLNNVALSGSGRVIHGDHIFDTRSRCAATVRDGAWVYARSAAISDAASTALMAMTLDEIGHLCAQEQIGALLQEKAGEALQMIGAWPTASNE